MTHTVVRYSEALSLNSARNFLCGLHCEVCASVAVVHPEAEAKDLVHCEWQEAEILRLPLRMTVMQFSRSDTLPKWRQMFLKGLRALFLLKACKRHTLAFVMDKPDQCRSAVV